MADKLDKLGRRIPQFDRSAAGKKAHATRKEKHGADEWRDANSRGGSHRTRGYFGYLKDNQQEEVLRNLSKAAREAKEARKHRADPVDGTAE